MQSRTDKSVKREESRQRHVARVLELRKRIVVVPHGFQYIGKIVTRHYMQHPETGNIYRSSAPEPTAQHGWIFAHYAADWSQWRDMVTPAVETIQHETAAQYRARGGKGSVTEVPRNTNQ